MLARVRPELLHAGTVLSALAVASLIGTRLGSASTSRFGFGFWAYQPSLIGMPISNVGFAWAREKVGQLWDDYTQQVPK